MYIISVTQLCNQTVDLPYF